MGTLVESRVSLGGLGPDFALLFSLTRTWVPHSCCEAGFGFSASQQGWDSIKHPFLACAYETSVRARHSACPLGMGARSEKGRIGRQQRPSLRAQTAAGLGVRPQRKLLNKPTIPSGVVFHGTQPDVQAADDSCRGFAHEWVVFRFGFSVRTAEDGFTALQILREVLPDIILSDLRMPGMSGFELLSIVRRRFPAQLPSAASIFLPTCRLGC